MARPQRRLPRILHRRRLWIFVGLVANGMVQAAAAIGGALTIRYLFAALGGVGEPAARLEFLRAAGLLLGLALGAVLLRVVERREGERLSQDYVAAVRLKLFDAIADTPSGVMVRRSRGPLMLRFASDLTAVQQWVGRGLGRLTVGGLSVAGLLVALFLCDPRLGMSVGLIALAGAATVWVLGRPLERRVSETRRQRGRLAAHVADHLGSLAALHLFGRRHDERRRLKRDSRRLAELAVARAWLSGTVRVLPDAVHGLSVVLVLVVGADLLVAGAIDVGALVAAMAMVGLLALPLRDLARVFDYWKNHKVAVRKLDQVLAMAGPRRSEKPNLVLPKSGQLTYRNLRLSGLPGRISAQIEPGTTVAIVGPSGSGKSELLALAAGLRTPHEGRVRIDGVAPTRLGSAAIARCVGMVSKELPLLRGTIFRNIVYRRPTASREEIDDVICRVGLDTALARLPRGLDTPIADGGADLPEGCAARIELARALLGEPPLMLLDDPDRGLDPAGRAALDRILAERRRTVLLVTQSLERARTADRIWYLEGGDLRENGPPADLLSRDGPTARFFGLVASPRLAVVT